VTTAGTRPWGELGVPLCGVAGIQLEPILAEDGAGGAIVVWVDVRSGEGDLYAQHLISTGATTWDASGVALCAAAGYQEIMTLVSDGVGGAIVAWQDPRFDLTYDPFLQRVDAGGVPQWTANGVAATGAAGAQQKLALAPDGAGGAILAWQDTRNSSWDVYAQRLERFGRPGQPEPTITSIRDARDDEGGAVAIQWTPSYLDSFPGFEIARYSIWRRVTGSLPAAANRRVRVTRAADGTAESWEEVATEPARGLGGYGATAPTLVDSVTGANPLTTFMVLAESDAGVPFWSSAPDSGYSVDDLAPPTPTGLQGTYLNGSALLVWDACPAGDFAAFQLHRGSSLDFVPDASNRIATTAQNAWLDHPGQPRWYKLCAFDAHGNRSPFAVALPNGTLDAPGGAPPRELALSAPAPNPLRSGTTLRLALPRDTRVALAVLDAQGRRVRALRSGALPAGEHGIAWDGRDDEGRHVAGGIYLVRLACEGRTITRRIAVVR
jgi:hypothetical protein